MCENSNNLRDGDGNYEIIEGVTDCPHPTVDTFEINWVIKNWPKMFYQTLEFPPFEGGPLTKHRWSCRLSKDDDNIIYFELFIRKTASLAKSVEAKFELTYIFQNGERKDSLNSFREVWIENAFDGDAFKTATKFQDSDQLDTLRLHCIVQAKIRAEVDAKFSLVPGISQKPPQSQPERNMQKLTADLWTLFQLKEYSDLKVVVAGVEILVHKAILSARSPVFARMLSTPMKESMDSRIEIEEFEPEVVTAMLQFIYTGKTEIGEGLAQDLFKIADKYEIQGLKNECEIQLMGELNISNAIRQLELADIYSAQSLKIHLMGFIHRNMSSIVKTEGYKEMAKSNVQILTQILLWKN